jgi:endonuclease YncB( thermonuclease family)
MIPQPPPATPKPQRRQRWPWVLGVLAFLLVLSAVNGGTPPVAPPPPAAYSSTPAPAAPYSSTPAAPDYSSTPAPATDAVRVVRVIDGDTFEVAGGRTIRVLGIDSCEIGTDGGSRAKTAAEAELFGETVTLTAEPGVDQDRYDRELRYVQVDGHDFGTAMVRGTHTGVYAGDNDASAAYVRDLRAADAATGSVCAAPAPTTTADDNVYVPVPVPDADVDVPDRHHCRDSHGRFASC